jgi:hypothetical protein
MTITIILGTMFIMVVMMIHIQNNLSNKAQI